jgi:hypothetical protein
MRISPALMLASTQLPPTLQPEAAVAIGPAENRPAARAKKSREHNKPDFPPPILAFPHFDWQILV